MGKFAHASDGPQASEATHEGTGVGALCRVCAQSIVMGTIVLRVPWTSGELSYAHQACGYYTDAEIAAQPEPPRGQFEAWKAPDGTWTVGGDFVMRKGRRYARIAISYPNEQSAKEYVRSWNAARKARWEKWASLQPTRSGVALR